MTERLENINEELTDISKLVTQVEVKIIINRKVQNLIVCLTMFLVYSPCEFHWILVT